MINKKIVIKSAESVEYELDISEFSFSINYQREFEEVVIENISDLNGLVNLNLKKLFQQRNNDMNNLYNNKITLELYINNNKIISTEGYLVIYAYYVNEIDSKIMENIKLTLEK